ncbi:MAG: helix-turn-helix domain-containing protein, partial [Actinomycetes bacterium]
MSATQTPQRLQLGRELRTWRLRSGMEARAVAQVLVCSPSKVSKIESGQATVSPLELQMLLRLYAVPEGEPTERITAVAASARQRSQHRVAPWLRAYVGYEAEAVEIKLFHIDLMPGLLQTEAYTRAIIAPHDPAMDRTGVERLVAIRRERQARLLDDAPPRLHAIVHEAAIRSLVGGREVMREQLKRLLELSELPTVSLQVLPFSVGAHPSMGTAFSILRLSGPDSGQVAVLE